MIQVQAFARYRELLGFQLESFPLPDPPTVEGLLAQPRLEALPREAMVAVNRAFATRETGIRDGDEVALMPPVSGG
ncbi:MAG TPA: MoaD/ThiS family protein [Holophaga sp.]|nr:MoaD/ThiS family protein [Holophaga sp.]